MQIILLKSEKEKQGIKSPLVIIKYSYSIRELSFTSTHIHKKKKQTNKNNLNDCVPSQSVVVVLNNRINIPKLFRQVGQSK